MQNHSFLNTLNTRRANNNDQLSSTIEDLLRQVEDLRQQLKQSQDAAQREGGAEGIAKEAAKAVVRATKMLMATYGDEGVELFREHLDAIIDNPSDFDGDWEPSGNDLPELPASEENTESESVEPSPKNGSSPATPTTVEVKAEVATEPEPLPETNKPKYDLSGFKTVKDLKAFALDYIDIRRKNRSQIEEELQEVLKEHRVTQQSIDQELEGLARLLPFSKT